MTRLLDMSEMPDDPNCYCFIDSETRALPGTQFPDHDVSHCGAYRYAKSAFPVMWTYAIGEQPVGIAALDDGFDERIDWELDMQPLHEFHERAMRGAAFYVAWNMAFDREIWNNEESQFGGFPWMKIDMSLDAMVQAGSSGLPGKLDGAAKFMKLGGKQETGKGLINIFAPPEGGTPQSHPTEWEEYKRYGIRDTDLLRRIFLGTRFLPPEEWHDYHVSERVNSRGFAVDVAFAMRGAALADAELARMNDALIRQTNGQIQKVTEVARIAKFVNERCGRQAVKDMLTKDWIEPEDMDEDDEKIQGKLSLARDRIDAILVYYEDLKAKGKLEEIDELIMDVLTIRQFGGSNTPQKFTKVLRTVDADGRLRGQYVFNGAPQTGRYSSRGVQVHNLTRSSLGSLEEAAIEAINDIELEE
jgi:hypothetical protein